MRPESKSLMYGTGATIYGTENPTTWDSGGKITIKPMVAGLEESAVLDLVSPPAGAPLISGLVTSAAFATTGSTSYRRSMFLRPNFTTTTTSAVVLRKRPARHHLWNGTYTRAGRRSR